jgi:hypothetical protein
LGESVGPLPFGVGAGLDPAGGLPHVERDGSGLELAGRGIGRDEKGPSEITY